MSFDALDEDIMLNLCRSLRYAQMWEASWFADPGHWQVNKILRRVAFVKQLWLSLVRDLTFRGLVELAPVEDEELESHSTTELVQFVMRAVAYSRLPHLLGSFTRVQSHRRLAFRSGVDWRSIWNATLLPGARYAVVRIPTGLHIYEVSSGRRIWTRAFDMFSNYSIDKTRGGAMTRFLLQTEEGNICIEEVDLATGESWEVFAFDLQGANGLYNTRIVDDFFVCTLRPSNGEGTSLLLVNWPAATWMFLDLGFVPSSTWTEPEIIPGYIVLAYPDSTPPHQLLLAVTDLRSLSPHFQPLDEFSLDDRNRVSLQDIPSAARTRLEYEGRPIMSFPIFLSTVPCMLHRDSFNIVVSTRQEQPPLRPSLVARFRQLITRRQPSAPPTTQLHAYYRFMSRASGQYSISPTLNGQFTRRVQIGIETGQVDGGRDTFVVVRYNSDLVGYKCI
ncbi:hypothetical protein DFH08DRAFT_798633 [Mycena albidolilacea]|uniref:F-box domain-containing protein n=1 Tax=Mycena albidolilacea TaxID=1033008 RepID=A0AAD7F225_9AGAR|nr:hypothetical protein DFH08DRAFT_798633 [Mycena albidolilacea]